MCVCVCVCLCVCVSVCVCVDDDAADGLVFGSREYVDRCDDHYSPSFLIVRLSLAKKTFTLHLLFSSCCFFFVFFVFCIRKSFQPMLEL